MRDPEGNAEVKYPGFTKVKYLSQHFFQLILATCSKTSKYFFFLHCTFVTIVKALLELFHPYPMPALAPQLYSQSQLPAPIHSGRQEVMTQVAGFLLPTRQCWMEFLTSRS